MHTIHSDGLNRVEQMVARAQSLGYSWLGLADHAPGADHRYRITVDRFLKRLEAAHAASQRYSLRVYQGIEADLFEYGLQDIPREISNHLDYVLVSSHDPLLEISNGYLRALEKAFDHELVKGYAHPFWMLDFSKYRGLIAEAVDLAVARNIAVELNFYPDSIRANQFLISEVRRLGGAIVLSTDAHHVNALPLMRFAAAFLREEEPIDPLNFQSMPLP